jgi:hypothetical protein
MLGGLFLASLMLFGGGAYVIHVSRRVNAALPASAQARTARARSAAGTSVRAIRAQARADDWLERQRDKRTARTAAGTLPVRQRAGKLARSGASGTKAAAGRAGRSAAAAARRRIVVQEPPELAAAPAGAANVIPMDPGQRNGRVKAQPPPVPAPARSPAPDPATRKAPAMPTTPSGAGADLFTAVQHIIGHAEAGGVQAKYRALSQLQEATEWMSGALEGFARRLAEPDQGYGPAVWEPVATASAHIRAASMASAEGQAALSALLALTIGEAATSSVKVPHHDEINAPA